MTIETKQRTVDVASMKQIQVTNTGPSFKDLPWTAFLADFHQTQPYETIQINKVTIITSQNAPVFAQIICDNGSSLIKNDGLKLKLLHENWYYPDKKQIEEIVVDGGVPKEHSPFVPIVPFVILCASRTEIAIFVASDSSPPDVTVNIEYTVFSGPDMLIFLKLLELGIAKPDSFYISFYQWILFFVAAEKQGETTPKLDALRKELEAAFFKMGIELKLPPTPP